MRVVHVTTVPQTLNFFSGQVRFMRSCGLEVGAISSPGPKLDKFGETHGIPTYGVPMLRRISPFQDCLALWRLWRRLRRIRPDIVHASTPKAGLLGVLAARAAGVGVSVFHIHGLPHLAARGLKRSLLIASTRIAGRLASHIYCVSHSLARLLAESGLCPAAKILVFQGGSSNGVDAQERFNPARFPVEARAELRRHYGMPEDGLVVGFVGRIVPDKGIRELAESWSVVEREFPTACLAIAGVFEAEYPLAEQVRKYLQENPRIILCDWVEDMPGFYHTLDMLALPSYREGFPNAVLEASAMAVPVIASSVPGCADSVVAGETGLAIPAGQVKPLNDALRRYLGDAGLRSQHGQAGRERALREFRPEAIWKQNYEHYLNLFATSQERSRRKPAGLVLKRIADVLVGGSILLVALLPLLLIALAIRLTMGAPVLFRQERVGLAERRFTIFKFRTMRRETKAARGPQSDADRLTGLGRFLRATSLDELPQLWNVLRGDMSLVGPRPLLVRYLERYTPEQRRRHAVRPGITGWAQVNGRNSICWEDKLALDVWYVQHWSLWLDCKTIVRTALIVLSGRGVGAGHRVTMPEFRGSEERPQPCKS